MPKLSVAKIQSALPSSTGWTLRAAEGTKPNEISKTYKTGSFLAGLAFVTQVAVLAEKHEHHPDVLLTYPKVTLTLTTHDAGGVTEKDIALAEEIDGLK